MSIRRIAVIGMGALGTLYGTFLLDHDPDVSLYYVMDHERLEKNRGKVLYRNGTAYELPLCESRDASPADLVIVAVKYPGLSSAMETMKNCVGPETIILSVLNGISSEELLAERFGKEHLIYTVAQGMDAMKFGDRLNYTHMGELRIGILDPVQQKNLDRTAEYFSRIGMPYTLDEDIRRRMWGKFMLNVGINQCCMVYETDYAGCLAEGEANRMMIAAMREVIALAHCEQVNIGEDDLNEYIAIIKTLSPQGMPSMRQDGLAHRPSEVEMFAGTVLSLAKKHGIYVPANRYLYERIKQMESEYEPLS